jgi:hypothetical protein
MSRREFREQAIRYFLGELSEAEQSAVEERFFLDEDYSRFLDAAEEDLINLYVRGELDFQQEQNFESHFLISERRRERVRSAQILESEFSAEKENSALSLIAPPGSFRRWRFENLFHIPRLARAGGLAVAAILILLGSLLLVRSPEENPTAVIEYKNPTHAKSSLSLISPPAGEKPPELKTVQKQTIRQKEISKPVAKLDLKTRRKMPPAVALAKPKTIPALTLLPPPMKNAEKPLIAGSGGRRIENIRLRVVVHRSAQNFVKYLVEIRASDGDLVWSREIAVSEKTLRKPLALDVRSGALASDASYDLTISGATDDGQLEEINSYNFSVQKK